MVAVLIFFCLILIFYGSLFLGKHLAKSYKYVIRLGKKTHDSKTTEYKNSKFFTPLRNAITKGHLIKGTLFIAPLIILKSIAFYFISILFIAPFILVFQGIAMGSLFMFYRKKAKNTKDLATITFWQLFSHITAATYGTLIGLEKFYNIYILSDSRSIILYNINIWVLASIIMACLAAYFEVKSLLKEKENIAI